MMLNKLYDYLDDNELQINLNKTKIMIFNKGKGRTSKTDFYRNKVRIERVSSFSYLGIVVKQDITYSEHICARSKQAKHSIAAMWNGIFSNENIAENLKLQVYKTSVETIALYGSELWGGNSNEEIESVQNYFYKRLYSMPLHTPNYMITTELDVNPLWAKAATRRNQYELSISRGQRGGPLVKVITLELKMRGLGIQSEIEKRCELMGMEMGTHLESTEGLEWAMSMSETWKKKEYKLAMIRKAFESHSRLLYPTLILSPAYMKNPNLTVKQKGMIWKWRADLTGLGWTPYLNTVEQCHVCGDKVRPDSFHFLSGCRGLCGVREDLLGEEQLTIERTRGLLNNFNEETVWRLEELYRVADATCSATPNVNT